MFILFKTKRELRCPWCHSTRGFRRYPNGHTAQCLNCFHVVFMAFSQPTATTLRNATGAPSTPLPACATRHPFQGTITRGVKNETL